MKVIIQHDDHCPESERGKHSWLIAFENMQRESRKDFSSPDAMHLHADKWAELAQQIGCNCGAAVEIERREKERERNRIAVDS